MVHLIVGHKGKGKSKILIDRVNAQIKDVRGSVVYIDHSLRHMYELNNQIRYINFKNYPITNGDQLLGFLCGILSQNSDIQVMAMDGLLNVREFTTEELTHLIRQIEDLTNQHGIEFTISLALDKEHIPEELHDKVLVSL